MSENYDDDGRWIKENLRTFGLPDGTRTKDTELFGVEWEKCQRFMQRIFPEHKITSMNPGFEMHSFSEKDVLGRAEYRNKMEFSTETYLHLLKNKDEIAKRLLEDLP